MYASTSERMSVDSLRGNQFMFVFGNENDNKILLFFVFLVLFQERMVACV